jgi:hypothetical protein
VNGEIDRVKVAQALFEKRARGFVPLDSRRADPNAASNGTKPQNDG